MPRIVRPTFGAVLLGVVAVHKRPPGAGQQEWRETVLPLPVGALASRGSIGNALSVQLNSCAPMVVAQIKLARCFAAAAARVAAAPAQRSPPADTQRQVPLLDRHSLHRPSPHHVHAGNSHGDDLPGWRRGSQQPLPHQQQRRPPRRPAPQVGGPVCWRCWEEARRPPGAARADCKRAGSSPSCPPSTPALLPLLAPAPAHRAGMLGRPGANGRQRQPPQPGEGQRRHRSSAPKPRRPRSPSTRSPCPSIAPRSHSTSPPAGLPPPPTSLAPARPASGPPLAARSRPAAPQERSRSRPPPPWRCGSGGSSCAQAERASRRRSVGVRRQQPATQLCGRSSPLFASAVLLAWPTGLQPGCPAHSRSTACCLPTAPPNRRRL